MKRFFSYLLIAMMMLFACASMASEASASEHMTYIVKKGDTLWGIAKHFNTTWPTLQKINHLKNPDLIHPNDVLRLRHNEEGLKNVTTARAQRSVAKEMSTKVEKKSPPAHMQHTLKTTQVCDPLHAITQLDFPPLVAQDLMGKVKNGQYEDIIDQENIPREHARKYIAYDTDHKYAFIYPDSCTWQMKSILPRQEGQDAPPKIPPSLTDRNENEKSLALPLGPTPGNVDKVMERSGGRGDEFIVLVRYLNNCTTANSCDAREAKGELYMQRE